MVLKPEFVFLRIEPVILRVPQQIVPAPHQILLGRLTLQPVRRLISRKARFQVRAEFDKIESAAVVHEQIVKPRQVIPLLLHFERAHIGEDDVDIVLDRKFKRLLPEEPVEFLLRRRREPEDPVRDFNTVVIDHQIILQFVPKAFRDYHLADCLRSAYNYQVCHAFSLK